MVAQQSSRPRGQFVDRSVVGGDESHVRLSGGRDMRNRHITSPRTNQIPDYLGDLSEHPPEIAKDRGTANPAANQSDPKRSLVTILAAVAPIAAAVFALAGVIGSAVI